MTTDVKQVINTTITTDQDLVELAGLHAYLEYGKDQVFEVNEKVYRVRDSYFNEDPTGLDAMTIQNMTSGEYHIVYMGTNVHGKYGTADVVTDVKLLTAPVPAQLEGAEHYFVKMEQKYGEITSVTGNSLGGALANMVGVRHEHVRSVTLNPALLPANAVETDREYDNIVNYIGQYDILNIGVSSIGLGNQVPGARHTIYNGIPSTAGIGFNHTGYIREDGKHVSHVTVGTEGAPGYGVIKVDAHYHLVSSIWTGQPLYGGRSERIDLNVETIRLLSDGIETSVLDRLDWAQQYVNHSMEIITHESAVYDTRLNQLREIYQESVENIVEDGLLRYIRFGNGMFKQVIQGLHMVVDVIEARCESLNFLLEYPPVALLKFITKKTIDLDAVFAEIRSYLRRLEDQLDEFIAAIDDIVMRKIEDIFKAGQERFHDVVVGELASHFNYVTTNYSNMFDQVKEFGTQVDQVAVAFETIDNRLASAISNQSGVGDVGKIQQTTAVEMIESPYLLNFMALKEQCLNIAMEQFKTGSSFILLPIATSLKTTVSLIEWSGEQITSIIRTGTNIHLYGNPGNLILSTFTNYDENVKAKVNEILEPMDELNEMLRGVRTGLQKFLTNYPVVVDNLRPYIDSALFNDSGYYNIHIYNSAATSILKDMQLLFDDIVFQLSDHEAEAITVLHDVSSSVKTNMSILEEQIERAATW
ncbi:hypothetical protein HXA31_13900 [Salipaludibacillus agaradhaerens]|uniref:Uncharacterized protein n=1 Tax=Salipaludibacillus agaradhaerens TaxID=76935 RepID=A0A9Q4AYP9_SALAG|nr:hypothetical protein [Salipaludibacillus agaradhaerens]MCR6094985.1 hypothetical protein [Salipaludibacillus agaradhaerens]MCR6115457.1 hypothetical protein [Salipaludibacillus agaradhaerens]